MDIARSDKGVCLPPAQRRTHSSRTCHDDGTLAVSGSEDDIDSSVYSSVLYSGICKDEFDHVYLLHDAPLPPFRPSTRPCAISIRAVDSLLPHCFPDSSGHRLRRQVDDSLYVGPLLGIDDQHGIDQFNKLFRITTGMPISSASNSHGDRLSICLKWRVPIRTSEQGASERLVSSALTILRRLDRHTHPNIDLLVQGLACLHVKQLWCAIWHRRVFACDILF